MLALPRKAHVAMSTAVHPPNAFLVAPSAGTAPSHALSCSPRRRHGGQRSQSAPFSLRYCVLWPCQKAGLFLPIILIPSRSVIGIELSVWKLLVRTQRIEERLEAELWEDSCRRPLGRGGSGFLEPQYGPQVDVSFGRDFLVSQ